MKLSEVLKSRGLTCAIPYADVSKMLKMISESRADDLDVNASPIITGEKEIQDLGVEIYAEMLNVAAGKRTKAEILGHFED